MGKKKTDQDYHELAREKGLTWLGSNASGVEEYTWWKGTCGHRVKMMYTQVRQGRHLCLACVYEENISKRRIPASEYIKLAESRGYKWLGEKVKSVENSSKWLCPNGHIWKGTYTSMQSGSGCLYCSSRRPKTEQDYHNIATSRGFVWLGPLPQNISKKTTWKCAKGHVWKAAFSGLRQGKGCHICAMECRKKALRLPSSLYYEVAAKRDVTWLGPHTSVVQNTGWRCVRCGQTFYSTYRSLEKRRVGCIPCGREDRALARKALGKRDWRAEYPPEFDAEFKKRIRKRDLFQCAVCGEKQNGERLSVHHIDYIKTNCLPANCISLCRVCHNNTSGCRVYWQIRLTRLIRTRHETQDWSILLAACDIHS